MIAAESKNANDPGQPKKQGAARLAVISNGVLTVVKVLAAFATGSVSVLAETVHSSGDLLGSLISYYTIRVAAIPPDQEHAYGHGKFENMSGIFIAVLIMLGGVFTFSEALHRLLVHTPVPHTGPAITVMAVAALVNILVSNYMLRVGRATDSPALTADGKHLQTDILTSTGVLISLIATRVTGKFWMDPAAALAVTGIVFWVGAQIARDALMSLSDIALPPNEEQILRDALNADPKVLGFHRLRTRKSGSYRHVDVHVQIADSHTFVEAHNLTEELEDKLRATLPNLYPIIHIEPFEEEARHQREAHRVEQQAQKASREKRRDMAEPS